MHEEDFENGPGKLAIEDEESGWQVEEEDGNHLLCNLDRSKPALQISIGDEKWSNYQLEFEAKDKKFEYAGSEFINLHLRKSENAHYQFIAYFLGYQNSTQVFTTESSRVELIRKKRASGEYYDILTEYLDPPVENQWYSVRITLVDGNVKFTWNDKSIIDYFDEDYLPAGSIRIGTTYGICIDNLRITSIGNPRQE